jgi:hypothetical protein
MFHKNRCYNGGNKHKFEPRYTEKEIVGLSKMSIKSAPAAADIRSLMLKKCYIYDICIWCGKLIYSISPTLEEK